MTKKVKAKGVRNKSKPNSKENTVIVDELAALIGLTASRVQKTIRFDAEVYRDAMAVAWFTRVDFAMWLDKAIIEAIAKELNEDPELKALDILDVREKYRAHLSGMKAKKASLYSNLNKGKS